MHYKCLLITKEFPTEKKISEILKPYDEDKYFSEEEEERGKRPIFMWDWYQIGGRYNGSLKLKYSSDDNCAKYRWAFLERDDRNGRLFWSYLLTKMSGFANRSFMYKEEDYFPSMGASDGYLYVDGAYIEDLLNFDEVEAYCCIDKDGSAHARETWDGNAWLENKNFDDEMKRIKADSSDCFVTVIDLHD